MISEGVELRLYLQPADECARVCSSLKRARGLALTNLEQRSAGVKRSLAAAAMRPFSRACVRYRLTMANVVLVGSLEKGADDDDDKAVVEPTTG